MKLYKLEKGKIKPYNEGFVVLDNQICTNPTIEILNQVGYKPLIMDEEPVYDAETQYLEKVYEESEESILGHWEVREAEPIEEVEEAEE